MKQGLEIGTIVLNSQTSTNYFKESGLYVNQNLDRFFGSMDVA